LFHPSDDHPGHPRGSRDHYDRNQPRVPPGHPDGGQWTSGGGWPLSDLAELPAPDLRKPEIPRIRPGMYPEYAQLRRPRSSARPDTPLAAPPEPPKQPEPPRITLPDISAFIGLGLLLLHQFSRDDSDDEHVVVGVRAREFRRDARHVEFGSERKLSEEEVEKYCPDVKVIQNVLDLAVDNIGNQDDFVGNKKDTGAYGKAIDREFKKILRKVNKDRLKKGNPEIFLIDETFSWNGEEKDRKPNSADSTTPDAIQRRGINGCVYEASTGEGISRARMLALVHNISKDDRMDAIMNLILTSVRPSRLPPPPRRMP